MDQMRPLFGGLLLLMALLTAAAPPAAADPGECTVTVEGDTCSFHCHPTNQFPAGYELEVLVQGDVGETVSGVAECGGALARCTGTTSCWAEDAPILFAETGTCKLIEGNSATCRSKHIDI